MGAGCISAEFMGGEARFDDIDEECWCELRDAFVETEPLTEVG